MLRLDLFTLPGVTEVAAKFGVREAPFVPFDPVLFPLLESSRFTATGLARFSSSSGPSWFSRSLFALLATVLRLLPLLLLLSSTTLSPFVFTRLVEEPL